MLDFHLIAGSNLHMVYLAILVTTCVAITRWMPWVLQKQFRSSAVLKRVGWCLPGAIMMALFLYKVKSIPLTAPFYGMLDGFCLIVGLCLYYWRRNLIVGLLPATLLYVIVLNFY